MESKYDHKTEKAIELYGAKLLSYRLSPLLFVEDMWGLTPQGIKPEYKNQWDDVKRSTYESWEAIKHSVKPEWFGTWNDATKEWEWFDYTKGKNLSWQQTLILIGLEKACKGQAPRHLSTVSGHGIGKSATCAWIILWFLYCFQNSQVPVTAPTSHQMHDVLWKELSIWIGKMPEGVKDMYIHTSDYVRIVYQPDSWFARARTSTKENTEAIAGVHADHVLMVCDEASGIPNAVFDAAEGALTSGNVFVILISNGTRTTGYFFDTHHKHKSDWQNFSFNCEETPLVNRKYVERQAKRHGIDSDEYKIRVKGGFPGEDSMDTSGYLQLIPDTRITVLPIIGDPVFIGRKWLGIDPAGEGKDKATFWIRDRFTAQQMCEMKTSDAKQIAKKAVELIAQYNINPHDVVVDSLGVGSDVGKEIALLTKGKMNVYTVLVGNHPKDEEKNSTFFNRKDNEYDPDNDKADMYLNLRALMFFRARTWFYAGGVMNDRNPESSEAKAEWVSIKYKRSMQGSKIQLMSKKEMLKDGIKSPNDADGLALTFLRDNNDDKIQTQEEIEDIHRENTEIVDRFSVV